LDFEKRKFLVVDVEQIDFEKRKALVAKAIRLPLWILKTFTPYENMKYFKWNLKLTM